jgi:hypothetical protein
MATRSTAIGLLCALSALPALAAPPDPGWSRYVNERYGTSAEVPLGLFEAQPPPGNEGGRTFRAKDGAELRVYGSYAPSVVTETFEEYKGWLLNTIRDDGVRVTYRADGRGWLVYSGLKGSAIVYSKVIEGCGAAHTVHMEYPRRLKALYDPVVARVAGSLRCDAAGRQP